MKVTSERRDLRERILNSFNKNFITSTV